MNRRERHREHMMTEVRAWTICGETVEQIAQRLWISKRQVSRYQQYLRAAGRLR